LQKEWRKKSDEQLVEKTKEDQELEKATALVIEPLG